MYVKCNECGRDTWVDDPPDAVYRIDTGCPCGVEFVLYCEKGDVLLTDGCTVKDAKDLS